MLGSHALFPPPPKKLKDYKTLSIQRGGDSIFLHLTLGKSKWKESSYLGREKLKQGIS